MIAETSIELRVISGDGISPIYGVFKLRILIVLKSLEMKIVCTHSISVIIWLCQAGNDVQLNSFKAKYLFLKGVENEQNGTLYEAIQFYRRAVQLVPDIEFRLYDASKPKPRDRQDTESTEDGLETATEQDVNAYSDDDDDEGEDLLSRLQRFFSRSCSLCVPQHEQTMTHISSLPMEIVLYILRWVVSADLDIRSLELCSRVSRGFYLCSRDSEIWRLACIRWVQLSVITFQKSKEFGVQTAVV
uniref:F-box domain-containing protein n=1 Tax=Timema genevievae TaxID=629358 RepID=A0A7R9JZD3_TIMGE|nr:unnamed protein product [Timema genevievae]